MYVFFFAVGTVSLSLHRVCSTAIKQTLSVRPAFVIQSDLCMVHFNSFLRIYLCLCVHIYPCEFASMHACQCVCMRFACLAGSHAPVAPTPN